MPAISAGDDIGGACASLAGAISGH